MLEEAEMSPGLPPESGESSDGADGLRKKALLVKVSVWIQTPRNGSSRSEGG